MDKVDESGAIFNCSKGYISLWYVRFVLHPPADSSSGTSQVP